ncbi:copper-binding protein [Sphingomonas yabuuchiae]|nr:copper-binding protein [Sphingomonas yabuuchiae]
MLLVTPIAASALAQGSRPAASAVKSGSGSGTITAVDAKGGTVTIKHGPIPTIGWPAMTMTFRASPPDPAQGTAVGAAGRIHRQGEGYDGRSYGDQPALTTRADLRVSAPSPARAAQRSSTAPSRPSSGFR